MGQAFVDELVKLAKKNNKSDLRKALEYGIPPTVISVIAAHPFEHYLYGKDSKIRTKFWPHLGIRIVKGVAAGGTALTGAKYLESRRD